MFAQIVFLKKSLNWFPFSIFILYFNDSCNDLTISFSALNGGPVEREKFLKS